MTDPLNDLTDLKEVHYPDWDMVDDWLHPDRASRGIFTAIIFALLFWPTLCGIVWMANHYIGGG